MTNVALLAHAVNRTNTIVNQARQDLNDTATHLFAALDAGSSPVVITGAASAFYAAHQAEQAASAWFDAVYKGNPRQYHRPEDSVNDVRRMLAALDVLLIHAHHLVHVDCPCPACAEPERDEPTADDLVITEPEDTNPF